MRYSRTGLGNPALFRYCAALEHPDPTDPTSAAAFTLRLLARRILALTEEVAELTTQITRAVETRAPSLLHRYGVGPDTAAALLLPAGDNPPQHRSVLRRPLRGQSDRSIVRQDTPPPAQPRR